MAPRSTKCCACHDICADSWRSIPVGESTPNQRPLGDRFGLVCFHSFWRRPPRGWWIFAAGFLASACRDICPSRFTKCCAFHEICTPRSTKCCACHDICGDSWRSIPVGESAPNQRPLGDRFGLVWFGLACRDRFGLVRELRLSDQLVADSGWLGSDFRRATQPLRLSSCQPLSNSAT